MLDLLRKWWEMARDEWLIALLKVFPPLLRKFEAVFATSYDARHESFCMRYVLTPPLLLSPARV